MLVVMDFESVKLPAITSKSSSTDSPNGAVGLTLTLNEANLVDPIPTGPIRSEVELREIKLLVEARYAVATGDMLLPLLFTGMVTVAVSPGSRRPLLLPPGSKMVMLPNDRTGACPITVK
jgi:hypothetical protein